MRRVQTTCLTGVMTLLLGLPALGSAADLGVRGQLFPIQEQNFLVFIHQRLVQMQQDGELASAKNAFIARAKRHAMRPTPVAGLTTTTVGHSRLFDPSIVLQQSVLDAKGQVLIPAGTRVNPLDRVPFTETLVFFNNDDARQQAIVRHLLQNPPTPRVKLILVQGSVADAVNTFHQKIYFDQAGVLTAKFSLTQIPAVITPAGERLTITVVPIDAGDGKTKAEGTDAS